MTQAGEGAPLFRAIAALQRLTELFGERRLQLAAEVGLSEAQWRVLEEIASADFLPSLFARRRDRSPAAISKVLRQLADAGLVAASIDAHDARQRRYRLTARGRQALQRLRAARERAIQSIWRDLEPRELDAFARFAEELGLRLERYLRGAARRRR